LAGADKLAGAAELEILARDFEAVAILVNNLEALAGELT
jgi:hypothetical protein